MSFWPTFWVNHMLIPMSFWPTFWVNPNAILAHFLG